MKKRSFLLISFLLLLTCILSACGSQASNSGQAADGATTAKTTALKLHSGGCWTRDGDLVGNADLGETGDPSRWQSGSSPFFGAKIVSCDDVVFLSWTTGYDFYQVRWSRPGQSVQQFSTKNQGTLNFGNAHFQTIYNFTLQGCNNGFFGSKCTSWSPTVAVATYYPGDCHPGYVWRNATSGDNVCVLPATRDQAAYDNSQRFNRVDPQGPYGPDSCIQGYVWRNAFSGDNVCVLPATRDQAAYDNSQANNRSYH